MRKYFIFKHAKTELGETSMIEVYGFGDIMDLLDQTNILPRNIRINPMPRKVLKPTYEWQNGAYVVTCETGGLYRVVGVCNFKE